MQLKKSRSELKQQNVLSLTSRRRGLLQTPDSKVLFLGKDKEGMGGLKVRTIFINTLTKIIIILNKIISFGSQFPPCP
jgi:hypothetical protein